MSNSPTSVLERPFPSALGRFLTLWVGLMLATGLACSPVRLISSYDEIVDRGTSDLHSRIVSFVSRMETLSGKPEGAYEPNAAFYDDIHGTLSTLRLRARIQDKNEFTVTLLDELASNVERLRQLHELGKDRGLPKAIAEPALQAIETNCESIIKLEVAKRRGGTTAPN